MFCFIVLFHSYIEKDTRAPTLTNRKGSCDHDWVRNLWETFGAKIMIYQRLLESQPLDAQQKSDQLETVLQQ